MANKHAELIKRLNRKADVWDFLHPTAKRPNTYRDAAAAYRLLGGI